MNNTAFRFIQQIRFHLEALIPCLKNKRIVAAVSGGADSSVLLDVLHRLRKSAGFDLGVCHVNHGLRGDESIKDEQWVIQKTTEYQLPLTVRRFDSDEIEHVLAGNTEERARTLRYQLLAHTAEELGYDYIVTAHTKSDQAETVLHRLIRSSGPTGLAGILPLCEKHGQTVIRPLLHLTREQVLNYAAIMKVIYRHDRMNDDRRYTRVQIRHEWLPALKESLNPKIEDSLTQLADICRDEEQFWREHIHTLKTRLGEGTIERPYSRTLFSQLSRAEQRRFLYSCFTGNDLKPHGKQMEDSLHLLLRNTPQGEIHLSKKLGLFRRYEAFYFACPQPREKTDIQAVLQIPGVTTIHPLNMEIASHVIPADALQTETPGELSARFDYDRIQSELSARTWRDGDCIQPLGMTGRKKIKSVFQEHRIPREQRYRLPLILHQDDLIWVPGCCIAEPYKVTPSTQTVLELSLRSTDSQSIGIE